MTRTIHVEDLIGAVVEQADGTRLGRVVDAEVRPDAGWEIVMLILGRFAFLDRLDTLRAVPYRLGGFREEQVVAWSDVESFEERRIRLRAGAGARTARVEVPSGTAGEGRRVIEEPPR
jgi:hypothetical protein